MKMIHCKRFTFIIALLGSCSFLSINAQTAGLRRNDVESGVKKRVKKRISIARRDKSHVKKEAIRKKHSLDKKKKGLDQRIFIVAGAVLLGVVVFLLNNGEGGTEEEVGGGGGSQKVKNPLENADCEGLNEGVIYGRYGENTKFATLKLGADTKEKEWYATHIKKEDSPNEEAQFKKFLEEGNVVIDQDALGTLSQPSLTKLANGIREELRKARYRLTGPELIATIKDFFTVYEQAIERDELRLKQVIPKNRGEGNEDYATRIANIANPQQPDFLKEDGTWKDGITGLTLEERQQATVYNRALMSRPGKAQEYLNQLEFGDDYGTIRYSTFKRNMTTLDDVSNQLNKLGIPQEDALVLVFYVFQKLPERLFNVKTTKEREESIGLIEGIMGQLAGMFNHCHGRTKDVFSQIFDILGRGFGLVPATSFGAIYWALDDIKKVAVQKTYPIIIKADQHEVHAHNHIYKVLAEKKFALIPGYEAAQADRDGDMSYSGFDFRFRRLREEEKNRIIARAFFKVYTPLFIVKELVYYLLNTDKIGGIALDVNKVNADLYYIVYSQHLNKIPNNDPARVRALSMIFKDESYEQIKLDYLVYYLFRIGIFKAAKANDTCVLNVKTMKMGGLSSTGAFVPNNPNRGRKYVINY